MVLEAVGKREPQAAATHPAPETLQKIAVLGFEPGTGASAAAKLMLPPAAIPEEMGPSALMVSAKRLEIVILAVEDFEGSATLVAVKVTDGGEGKLCGAVRTPAEFMAPQAAPEHPAPPMLHETAVAGLPAEAIVA